MEQYTIGYICEQVIDVIRESLDVQSGDVDLSSNLARDLDGESIDFLDIVFRLEKAFKIKIERGQLEKTLRERFPDESIKPNSELTPELRSVLVELLPEVPPSQFDTIRKVKDVTRLFTVATFVRFTVSTLRKTRPDAIIQADVVAGFSPVQLGLVG